jgi:hypothetical protein
MENKTFCLGYTKTHKKCRLRVDNNQYCCEEHQPVNYDDFVNHGCCICYEKDIPREDIKILKCGHMFHKTCYEEWLAQYSRYDNKICMICRYEYGYKQKKKLRNYLLNKKGTKLNIYTTSIHSNILEFLYAK